MRWLTSRILSPLLWALDFLLLAVRWLARGGGYVFLAAGRAFKLAGYAFKWLGAVTLASRDKVGALLQQLWPPFPPAEDVPADLGFLLRVRRTIAQHGLVLWPALVVVVVVKIVLHLVIRAWRLVARLWRRMASFLNSTGRGFERLGRGVRGRIGKGRIRSEIRRFRTEARHVKRDVAAFSTEQQSANPLDPDRKTVFVLVTCGQAVRNFLLSDFFGLLRSRFNVVILTTYAYSEGFRKEYSLPGVHVLPWFSSFRTSMERMFQYYFMSQSRSRTHHSWLANLEARAKSDTDRARFRRLIVMRRLSDFLGALIGRRGMQGFYASYFMAYLPRSLFKFLFSTYRPELVISTTAHHAEAWPLTYFARRHGCKTLANILSWDNTTTKPIMDVACDYYTVWSEEMKGELAYQFPHIETEVIVTGCPLFDVYYQKPYALSREDFLAKVGLPADKPYILYATNTPAAMPDECQVIEQYWEALNRSPLGGKVGMLVRLHPKETVAKYQSLQGREGLVVTLAAKPHWDQSDRWLPNHEDMSLLLNSMMHAAVSVNVASTMSLESFALDLPTINIGFKSREDLKDHGSMWSFDMYHFSEHYHAIVDNGSVDLARSVDELVAYTMAALKSPNRHKEAMRTTLNQKSAYCDGTSGRRFFEVIESIVDAGELRQPTADAVEPRAIPGQASRLEVVEAAE